MTDRKHPLASGDIFVVGRHLSSPDVARLTGRRVFRHRHLRRTATLDQLIELLGETIALNLVDALGGTRVFIPQNPDAQSPLAVKLGLDTARKLAEVLGGERVELPKPAARRARILELRQAGLTVDTIALELGCTRRRVFQVLAEARATAKTSFERSV